MSEKTYIKNVVHAQVHELAGLVEYQEGQVVSRTLSQTQGLSMTLFAFDAGEGLSGHSAPGDALVHVLDGKARVTIANKEYQVGEGQVIVMPAGVPHALDADERFKMLLTLVKG